MERAMKDAAVALFKVPSRGTEDDLKKLVQNNQSLNLV
jgi:hypothetical protein